MLRRGATSALPTLLDSLYERVVSHTGSKLLADDCTMLAVRRLVPGFRSHDTFKKFTAKAAKHAKKIKSGDTEDSFQYPLEGCTEEKQSHLITNYDFRFPFSYSPFTNF